MLTVREVSKAFGSGAGVIDALSNVSFAAAEGEILAIIGPTGCGKTSLLKIMGDLLLPTSGNVSVGNLSTYQARQQRMLSFVFQNPVLLPWRTVLENIQLPLEIYRGETWNDPRALVKLVGLDGYELLYPKQLSGGMQQRAALARALVVRPRLLLLDEPFSALDELTRAALNSELECILLETKITAVLVTHSISEALFLADRVLVLSSRPGTIKLDFSVPFSRPRDASIRGTELYQAATRSLYRELEKS